MLRRAFVLDTALIASGGAAKAQQSDPQPSTGARHGHPGRVSFPAFSQALVEAIRTVDPDLAVELRMTKGLSENLEFLKAGAVDLALVQG